MTEHFVELPVVELPVVELSVSDVMVERVITVSLLDELVFIFVSDEAPMCVRLSHGHRVIEIQFVRAESRRWSAVIAAAQLVGAYEVSEWTVEIRVESHVELLTVPMPYRELSLSDQTTYPYVMVGRVVLIDSRRRSLTRVLAAPALMIGLLATVVVAFGFARTSGWMLFLWSVLVAPSLGLMGLRFQRVRERPWWRSRVAMVASLSVFSLAVFMPAIYRTTWVRVIDDSAVTRARFGRAGTSKFWFAHELTEMEHDLAAQGLRVVPYRTADRCARERFDEPLGGWVLECSHRWAHVSLAAQQELGISSPNASGATDCVDLTPRGCGLTDSHATPFGPVDAHGFAVLPATMERIFDDDEPSQSIVRTELLVSASQRNALRDAIASDFTVYRFVVWGGLNVRAVHTLPRTAPVEMIWTMADTGAFDTSSRFGVRAFTGHGRVTFELLLSGGERMQVDCDGERFTSIDVFPFHSRVVSALARNGVPIATDWQLRSTVAVCREPENSGLSQAESDLLLGRVTEPSAMPLGWEFWNAYGREYLLKLTNSSRQPLAVGRIHRLKTMYRLLRNNPLPNAVEGEALFIAKNDPR